ncbi:NDP-hexose 2,3-dehydratase family protein [Ureibacillus chungkukjangi]|uniref:Oxidase EvaA n=1 Tax=Ureibacillus chungkukjangi TaxID=1202712 RepID=A0A318TQ57_9BACL|nr:NDP-hexose 2,3-dehydratase family protein [Ureibacillus chungkukjangi]MCM3386867.1 NDP-hexose 2,3-dehydratase family protein [Ureibacillus chungkukjangi]PYF06047.1 oxidase EvaA [Ureibacillus chungkukjangi]
MNSNSYKLLDSWLAKEGLHSTNFLLDWIHEQNRALEVKIEKIHLEDSDFWIYADGRIGNKSNSFFSISGIRQFQNGILVNEQPIILQDEIGFLGIICKEINGVFHFLMQAKIEPGNINKVQISPTIQATKSNFTQRHGGRKPAFLDYFLNAKPHEIIVDQIQSEQSSRFYKKRNRNVILCIDAPIEESSYHKWMTLGQLKKLMRYDNLVNMDTRTVLSCIPFSLMTLEAEELKKLEPSCNDQSLLHSLSGVANHHEITNLFSYINDYKMFYETENQLVELYSLEHWYMENGSFVCEHPSPFEIIFCDISIEGREVKNWTQPLFKAKGIATFGLICCEVNGTKEFLVKATPEIGCFDGIELGPTIQQEAVHDEKEDAITKLFYKKLSSHEGITIDVLLSEEGGRFYHEQNRNIIIELTNEEIPSDLPSGYFWSDFKTLNTLTQVNNCLNIQLRNLLSLLEV